MNEVVLNETFTALWRGRDPFEEIGRIEGEVFRKVKSRRTFRFELEGSGYFAKVHHGVGWAEIFKNLLQFKRPVLGARNEFAALKLLARLGVDTMTPCAYGERGRNPAKRDSFLVTAELAGMISLEDYCRDWFKTPPPFRRKAGLIRRLALTAGTMHRNGLNHRDCYICHFLLDPETVDSSCPRLYVIDLHRAEIRTRVPFHYQVKDVAGLYFSAMDLGLTRRDLYRFMKSYSGAAHLRETLRHDRILWRSVERAARRLYRKEFRKEPPRF